MTKKKPTSQELRYVMPTRLKDDAELTAIWIAAGKPKGTDYRIMHAFRGFKPLTHEQTFASRAEALANFAKFCYRPKTPQAFEIPNNLTDAPELRAIWIAAGSPFDQPSKAAAKFKLWCERNNLEPKNNKEASRFLFRFCAEAGAGT